MPTYPTPNLMEAGNSTNMLLMALDEMDKIIAESKLSLDSLSTSTTTINTSSLNGNPKSPEQANYRSNHIHHFPLFNKVDRNNQGSLPGNLAAVRPCYSPDMSNGQISSGKMEQCQQMSTSKSFADLVEELRIRLEHSCDRQEFQSVSEESRRVILHWLENPHQLKRQEEITQTNATRPDRLGEAVKLLENQRNNLQMQLSLLADKVNSQAEKIQELEDLLLERTCQLESTEALLQEEMLSRSSLETHKLDLLAEVTDMRAQMLATRKEMLKKSQSGSESNQIRSNSSDNLDQEIKQNNLAIAAQLRIEAEQGRLRKTVDFLTSALEEKDKRIRELQSRLNAQEKDGSPRYAEQRSEDTHDGNRKPPYVARPLTGYSPRRTYPLTLAHQTQNSSAASDDSLTRYTESMSQLSDGNGASTSSRVGSRRELSSRSPKRSRSSDARTVLASNRELANWPSGSFRFSPLSPSKSMGDTSYLVAPINYSQPRKDSIDSSSGYYQDINRSSSVPNLGRLGIESDHFRCSTPKSATSDEKKHGIRKFFEKFTRTHLSDLDESQNNNAHFKRGGFRATAGARLQHANSSHRKKWDPTVPLRNWSHETTIQWFEEIHIPLTKSARAWIVNGDQISKASLPELEKELNLTNPLLKKKFSLALKAAEDNDKHPMGKWDYLWVLRWLDDVGLPQYKDVFGEARIDGRMLNYLTTDDLFQLKITNAIHHASLAQGIQILRACNYDPSCIRRRPVKSDKPLESPDTVIFWSNHRLMEWLRHLDLTEYGPNLRGSGVHGALMVLENRFNADILADLLSIPQSKTLLRRHLNKSFVELVGSEMIRQKRAAEASPGFVFLSPHLKLKQNRKAFTLVKRKGKIETEDYLCPLESSIDFFLLGTSPDHSSTKSVTSSQKSASASPVLKPSVQNAVPSTSANSLLKNDLKDL